MSFEKMKFFINAIGLIGLFFVSIDTVGQVDEPLSAEGKKLISQIALFDKQILSSGAESSLTVSPGGKTLFFARKDSFYVSGAQSKIYTSEYVDDKWTEPTVAWFSGQHSDTGPFLSPDGKRLYFTSRRPVDGEEKNDADIWFLEKKGKKWNKPKHVSIYNSGKSEYSPTVDSDGNLYFGSYREGGVGWGDLWVSYFKNGKHQPPVNLGKAINTDDGEWGSCISPDGKFILFEASGREANITNDGDLYVSFKKNGVWEKAIHLGDLNSSGSDLSPRIHNGMLYFASNRHRDFMIEMNNNNVELYKVPLQAVWNYLGERK